MEHPDDITEAGIELGRVAALEVKIDRLEALVAQLERRSPEPAPPARAPAHDDASSRRSLLRVAALAATGAVAGAVALDATPAAAAGELLLQNTTQLSGTPTQVTCKVINPGAATFAFASGVGLVGAAASPSYPCALGGWSVEPAQPTGVYGYSAVVAGTGVVGHVDGSGSTVGVRGISVNGTGVIGNSATATGVFGGGASVGVAGDGVTGVSAAGSRYGIEVTRAGGARRCTSRPRATPAQHAWRRGRRVDADQAGELDVDAGGDLWYCVTAGTPGVWRKVAGTVLRRRVPRAGARTRLRLTDACSRSVGAARHRPVAPRERRGTARPDDRCRRPGRLRAGGCHGDRLQRHGRGHRRGRVPHDQPRRRHRDQRRDGELVGDRADPQQRGHPDAQRAGTS